MANELKQFEYMESEERNRHLEAYVDADGIYVSITEWAEIMSVTMPRHRARAFGEWLISVSGEA